jgi:type II secretory pathway component PulK
MGGNVTTEIMLVVALVAVVVLVMIVFALYIRMRYYRAEWWQAEERAREWLRSWKGVVLRVDELQNQLKSTRGQSANWASVARKYRDYANELEKQLSLATQTVDLVEHRADDLQTALRLEQIAHSVEE